MADKEGIFGKYPTAAFEVKGQVRYFPVIRIEEDHENRVVPHERAYRRGARLDDTNSKAKVWRLTVEAYNSEWMEEGVVKTAFYPDELNKLLDLFDVHETGTLTIPTRGPKRCRAHRYSRVETSEERDCAVIVLTFMEDNEDDANQSAWQAPSAHSVIVQKATDAVRACEDQAPMKADLFTMLRELAAAVESYANAPFEYIGDLEAQVRSLNNAVSSIEDTYNKRAEEAQAEVFEMLTDPAASRAGRLLRELSDTAGRVLKDKLKEGPKLFTSVPKHDTTLFAIAVTAGMDPQRLLEINSALDPFNVPAGTPVWLEE